MRVSRVIASMGLLLVVTAVSVFAQTAPKSSTPLSAPRKPAAPKAVASDESASAGDKWKILTDKNQMNDKPIVSAVLNAERAVTGWQVTYRPQLVVRCETPLRSMDMGIMPVQPGLDFYIITGMPATVENGEGKHTVFLRFDDAPAEQWGSSESTDKKALMLAPLYATRAIVVKGTLGKTQKLRVQFTPFNASPALVEFDTRGFEKHVDEVLAACPTVDKSKWLFPPSY